MKFPAVSSLFLSLSSPFQWRPLEPPDIDDFKLFNDTYGHPAGDCCLRAVANVLKENLVRNTDLMARYGGEEFACLLPATDQKGALEIAERLRKAVEQLAIPNKEAKPEGYITSSFGVAALVPERNARLEHLIELADEALYRAKSSGRNRVVSSDSNIRKAS